MEGMIFMHSNHIEDILIHRKNMHLKLVIQGILIGIITGLVILAVVFLAGLLFQTVSFEMIDISLFLIKLFGLMLFGAIGGIFGININKDCMILVYLSI